MRTSRTGATDQSMTSHTLTLRCGCVVYVSCHPVTGIAHTRIIQTRGRDCRDRRHDVGARLYLWELLPDPKHRPVPDWSGGESDAGQPAVPTNPRN